MNLTKTMTLAVGLLVAGAGYAQTTATSSSTGLLGQRYTELNVGTQDIKFISDNAYSVGAVANTPVVPGAFDAGVGYSYSWIRSGGVRSHANTFLGYGTYYVPLQGVKPFLGAGVGWQWTRTRGFGADDGGVWGAQLGAEIPVGAVTLTPRIVYADDFESGVNSTQEFTYEVEANYWVNAKTAVFASVGKTDILRSPARSWNYELGVRFKF